MAQFLYDSKKKFTLTVTSFDTQCYSLENLQNVSEQNCMKSIDLIHASGGTYFGESFKHIANQINSEINDLVLIYLTDGEVGDGRDTESHMAFEINRIKENISKFV